MITSIYKDMIISGDGLGLMIEWMRVIFCLCSD